ncbi:MAG: alpha-D-ribose 1-methylphosphonate 5-triphosphate diphosphatase [Geminicoccaceae bacterium]
MKLTSRRTLLPDAGVVPATVTIADGLIAEIGPPGDGEDLGDLLLAPGLVDIHGDAFERQIMPRPGVLFDLAMGLVDSDRQLLANGITTAFHGLTWSWEPGLRSPNTGRSLIEALDRLRPKLGGDHRWHLRFETFNLDGLEPAIDLIREGKVDLLALNDHTPGMAAAAAKPTGNLGAAIRAGVPLAQFNDLVRTVHARAPEVDAAMRRLAAAAREVGLPILSHDDEDPEERASYRDLGSHVAEFPKTLATAQAARAAGDAVVMGAPNALRGRSHLGALSATEAIEAGVCTVLASDYFYPALLQAPFSLARRGLLDLHEAWALVSGNPAAASGRDDRGAIAIGRRADLVVIDASDPDVALVHRTYVAGHEVYRCGP